jgi:phenylalanine ammonia-lyase
MVNNVIQIERVRQQQLEINSTCFDQTHQPTHPLFPTRTERRDNRLIGQPGAKGIAWNAQMPGINTDTRENAPGLEEAETFSNVSCAPRASMATSTPINGTTVMTAAASLVWVDARCVLSALPGAVALCVEALQARGPAVRRLVHECQGHPGRIAVASWLREALASSSYMTDSSRQSCYSLRCAPEGSVRAGKVWRTPARCSSARSIPRMTTRSSTLGQAPCIARKLLRRTHGAPAGPRFSNGLPANLALEPGVNAGFNGMQLSVTGLACAVRQMAGPSSIHSLPSEEYNEDVVILGMHAAVTAMDALECVRNLVAMVLLSAPQAVDLRGGPQSLGRRGCRIYKGTRAVAQFQDRDRPMEEEIDSGVLQMRIGPS